MLGKLGDMRRQRRQKLIIHLMLATLLLAPLQVFASVYTATDMTNMSMQAPMHECEEGKQGGHDCQHHKQTLAQKDNSHCDGEMGCSLHCNGCVHCQFVLSSPFTINHVRQTRIERATDIAFVSHIPQVGFRPPKHS